MPDEINNLAALRSFRFSGNQVPNPSHLLQMIRQMKHITSLDLSGCNLNYIPSEVRFLKNLRELNLSNNNLHFTY
ncbi:MAG: hypothetical protein HWD58_14985 [Bacteroidota bacterium]|nr:MAG: hypothetical protein HWD58_14985 [Bacteroidota bacterium]